MQKILNVFEDMFISEMYCLSLTYFYNVYESIQLSVGGMHCSDYVMYCVSYFDCEWLVFSLNKSILTYVSDWKCHIHFLLIESTEISLTWLLMIRKTQLTDTDKCVWFGWELYHCAINQSCLCRASVYVHINSWG